MSKDAIAGVVAAALVRQRRLTRYCVSCQGVHSSDPPGAAQLQKEPAMSTSAVIVDAVRTPLAKGKPGGA